MEIKEEILASVAKNFNVPGFVGDMLDGVGSKALDEAVAKTQTPLDDMAKAALYPVLSAELKKLIDQKWNELIVPKVG